MLLKKLFGTTILSSLLLVMGLTACNTSNPPTQPELNMMEYPDNTQHLPLPAPNTTGSLSLEETLADRRSIRAFQAIPLTDEKIGQLLWAAQGISDPAGLRTAPSAGATYPLEIYAATPDGAFRYNPADHSLTAVSMADLRPALHQAALNQDWVRDAPLVIIITAVFSRTSQRYGEARTPQYVFLEAGHAAQNILLQAVALGLGAVPVGAFHDELLVEALALPAGETPIYLIPVGHPK